MIKIAHIINPVKVGPASDLFTAQPITFETMRVAKEFAKEKADVELLSIQFPEDHEIIPEYFTKLSDLPRSVLDIRPFDQPRKYPLIHDILEAAYKHSDADYLIFTNVDIALMPQFYVAVSEWLNKGHDALIINRRRVSANYTTLDSIPLVYSDIGRPHPGFDCFVFHRDLFPKFILENICVGVPFIGVSMAHNIFCHSQNYKLLSRQHLTIHIGMDVMPPRDTQYHTYNRAEFDKVLKQLKPFLDSEKLPYSELPLLKKIIRWGLNPSVFILLNMQIEIKGRMNKLRFLWNELRFKWVSKG